MNESQLREDEEEEMIRRLQETISEMERLKAALDETSNRSQVRVCMHVPARVCVCASMCWTPYLIISQKPAYQEDASSVPYL